MTLAQRGQKEWRNALQGLERYVLERLHLGPEAVGKVRTSGRSLIFAVPSSLISAHAQVFALFVHRRRTLLRTMQVTYNTLKFPEKLPVDSDLLDLGFVQRVGEIIEEYRKELKGRGRDAEKSHMRPPPSSAIDATTGFSADQKTMLRGLIAAMRVTNLQWEKKSNLKGVPQVIRALGPSIMSTSLTEELLATKDGWSMRAELQAILTEEMSEGEWEWWDGINSRPSQEGAEEGTTIIQPLPEESAGNLAARTWLAPELRQENEKRIQKVIDATMQKGFGAMTVSRLRESTVTSPQMLQALKDFVMVSISSTEHKRAPTDLPPFPQALVIESEKHVSLIENPTVDPHAAATDEDRCAEMLSKYNLELPSMATYEQMEHFWAPKEGVRLRKVKELFLHDPTRQALLNMEQSERKNQERDKAKEQVFGSRGRREQNLRRRKMQQQERGESLGLNSPRVRTDRPAFPQTRWKKP